ncbi:MAG: EscU/YscU/HrcU family type III secretion system export apparatus switch protein [Nitrospirae bacterium]|nr:EscU/YscU/HrcU family type III secretion system export apparatus switch protein [Nitrospirota bacterium]
MGDEGKGSGGGQAGKLRRAVALRYRPPRDAAPRVTAKGRGLVAERIIELARANRIPIESEPDLVEILSKVDLFAEVPPEIYGAVAEILAFVYRLRPPRPTPSSPPRAPREASRAGA